MLEDTSGATENSKSEEEHERTNINMPALKKRMKDIGNLCINLCVYVLYVCVAVLVVRMLDDFFTHSPYCTVL